MAVCRYSPARKETCRAKAPLMGDRVRPSSGTFFINGPPCRDAQVTRLFHG